DASRAPLPALFTQPSHGNSGRGLAPFPPTRLGPTRGPADARPHGWRARVCALGGRLGVGAHAAVVSLRVGAAGTGARPAEVVGARGRPPRHADRRRRRTVFPGRAAKCPRGVGPSARVRAPSPDAAPGLELHALHGPLGGSVRVRRGADREPMAGAHRPLSDQSPRAFRVGASGRQTPPGGAV
ncbi:MAG: hypothetical protein AVDCRST_MAG86-1236, partial [uncultured Truepera sp.]